MIAGRIFVSYSHDNDEHREKVLSLANELRSSGVDSELDRYYDTEPPSEGWPRWMRRMLDEAEMVIVVCSETYRRRYEGHEEAIRGHGATWEGAIITQDLYETHLKQRKFIPVCFDDADVAQIPIELRATTHYILPRDYTTLYRRLTRQPELTKPALGLRSVLPVRETGSNAPTPLEKRPAYIHNLPFPPNPVFYGRTTALDELKAACRKQAIAAITQTAAVTGLGGIGKTQLAIEYAWDALERGDYSHVFWVRAESVQSLDADIASLASGELLNLPEGDLNEEASAREAVVRWLSTTREHWLLIADNADGEAEVDLLRARVPVRSNGHVIITSRKERWPGFAPVVLDTLAINSAVQVMRDCVSRDAPNHEAGDDETAQTLATELGCLPLALEQAAAVIASRRWTFARYLSAFHEQGAQLRKIHEIDPRRYPASIATTWLVTLDRLTLRAHIILQLASWLAPDEIPRTLFSEHGNLIPAPRGNRDAFSSFNVDQALSELNGLCLIRLTASTFSVHRLLQAVEQDQLDSLEERQTLLTTIAVLVQAFVPGRSDSFENWSRWILIRPHIEQVIIAASANSLHHVRVTFASHLAVFLWARGELPEAVRYARIALDAAQSDPSSDPHQVAVAKVNLGGLLEATNQLDEAEELLHDSVDVAQGSLNASEYDGASAFNNYGMLLATRGRLKEAEVYYRRAIKLREEGPADKRSSLPKMLSNLGLLLKTLARFDESETILRRALEIAERLHGPDHPDVAHALNDLGFLYRDLERYGEAELLLVRALKVVEAVFDTENRYLAAVLDNLGSLMRLTGRRDEAEPLIRRAVATTEALVGPDHPDLAIRLVNLGVLLQETGRVGEAERLFRRALKIDEVGLGSEHFEVANDLTRLVELLVRLGRLREAETHAKRALRIAEEHFSPSHPTSARIRETLDTLRAYRKRHIPR